MEIGQNLKIVNVPITLYWDSVRASQGNKTQSAQYNVTGNHRIFNKLVISGVTVYAIYNTSGAYVIGWVREDDVGNLGINTQEQITYTVKAGDYLYKIAKMFNVTVAELRAWNGIIGDLIHPNDVLIVQQGKTTVATEDQGKVEVKPAKYLEIEVEGERYILEEGTNFDVFELPVGATEVKIIGNGAVKFRYRPEVFG